MSAPILRFPIEKVRPAHAAQPTAEIRTGIVAWHLAAIVAGMLFLAIASSRPAHAAQPTAEIRTGIFGTIVARMDEIAAGYKAKGYRVIRRTWLMPTAKADVTIGHSAGAYGALTSGSKRIITIDPPMFPPACPTARSRCTNFYAPEDKLPFFVCCGGYRVTGATNVRVSPGHTTMPRRIARRAVSEGMR